MRKAWEFKENQYFNFRSKKYDAHSAIRYAKNLEPFEIPLKGLSIDYYAPCDDNLKSFARHMKQALEADLNEPIILNEDGVIIDGRHRVIKALVEEKETILAVRFDNDPSEIYTYLENKNG